LQLARTLSAYIARQFFAWFCCVFAAMAIITFLADYVELLRRGGSRAQATVGVLFEMAVLQLPQTLQEVLPFAVLFGTMLAFWRLTRNNELVVARAAGVSVWQFLTPAMLVALLIGIFAVTVFNPIASVAQASFERLDNKILHQGSNELSLSSAGLWLRQSDEAGNQIIIHAGKLASPHLVLDNVTLFFFDDLTQFTSRIDARSAQLEIGDWLIEDGMRWLPDKPPQHLASWRLPTQLTPRKKASPPRIRCRFGNCRASFACWRSRVSRRSAIACITTCCSPARFCCAEWCWLQRPSVFACNAAAASR